MYGIGAYYALENAIRAFNPNFKSTFDAPFTHEKVLIGLYGPLPSESHESREILKESVTAPDTLGEEST